jgi:hypothetical protein
MPWHHVLRRRGQAPGAKESPQERSRCKKIACHNTKTQPEFPRIGSAQRSSNAQSRVSGNTCDGDGSSGGDDDNDGGQPRQPLVHSRELPAVQGTSTAGSSNQVSSSEKSAGMSTMDQETGATRTKLVAHHKVLDALFQIEKDRPNPSPLALGQLLLFTLKATGSGNDGDDGSTSNAGGDGGPPRPQPARPLLGPSARGRLGREFQVQVSSCSWETTSSLSTSVELP